jgi:hypothetical protein
VPAEAAFEGAEERLRHPAEVRPFHIAILNVVRDTIGKDVLDLSFKDAKTVAFEELPAFAARISVGDGAACLRFRVFRDKVLQIPELAAAVGEQNPCDFVGTAMVDHDFEDRAGAGVLTELVEDDIGMRSVVDDAEGVDEIVRLDGSE